jgi:hypothetical protein
MRNMLLAAALAAAGACSLDEPERDADDDLPVDGGESPDEV